MFSIEHIKGNSWNGGYWESNFSIKLSENRFELLPRAEAYFEPFENLDYMPSNRKEALKLHRLLVDEYRIEIPLPRDGENVYLRYSIQGFNSQKDLDILYAALVAIIQNTDLIEIH